MKITRKELVGALCDVLDGIYNAYDVQAKTGCALRRCEEILLIRDGVIKEWMK